MEKSTEHCTFCTGTTRTPAHTTTTHTSLSARMCTIPIYISISFFCNNFLFLPLPFSLSLQNFVPSLFSLHSPPFSTPVTIVSFSRTFHVPLPLPPRLSFARLLAIRSRSTYQQSLLFFYICCSFHPLFDYQADPSIYAVFV